MVKKRWDLDKKSKWYDFDFIESKERLTSPKDIGGNTIPRKLSGIEILMVGVFFCLANCFIIYALSFDFDLWGIAMVLTTLMIVTIMNRGITNELIEKLTKKYGQR